MSQGLVAAKWRMAKKSVTIPRQESVNAYMAANIVDNVRRALVDFPVSLMESWTESTVVQRNRGVSPVHGK